MISRLILNKAFLIALKILFVSLLVVSAYLMLKEMPIRQQGWIYRDKLEHASLFFCLTSLALFLFKRYRLTFVFLLLSYGGATEYLQSTMTKTRTGSVADWLADLVGVCLACVMASLVAHLMNRVKKHEV